MKRFSFFVLMAVLVIFIAPAQAGAQMPPDDHGLSMAIVDGGCTGDGQAFLSVNVENRNDEAAYSVWVTDGRGVVAEPGTSATLTKYFVGKSVDSVEVYYAPLDTEKSAEYTRALHYTETLECAVAQPDEWVSISHGTETTCLPPGDTTFPVDITVTNVREDDGGIVLLEAGQMFLLRPGESQSFLRVSDGKDADFTIRYHAAKISDEVHEIVYSVNVPPTCQGTTVNPTAPAPPTGPEVSENPEEDILSRDNPAPAPAPAPEPEPTITTLPRTGSATLVLALGGFMLLSVGGTFVFIGRHKLATVKA